MPEDLHESLCFAFVFRDKDQIEVFVERAASVCQDVCRSTRSGDFNFDDVRDFVFPDTEIWNGIRTLVIQYFDLVSFSLIVFACLFNVLLVKITSLCCER
ncbi:hypothetical protein DVK06_12495 [Halorubrum sp. Atlit-28R]|nr:hypothetical protein DVK06_12495 [Halorubrum sp. Atlit-28R]